MYSQQISPVLVHSQAYLLSASEGGSLYPHSVTICVIILFLLCFLVRPAFLRFD